MAVSSLRYKPNAPVPEENKFGYVVFDGKPEDYHHWLFRTDMKVKTAKEGDMKSVVQQVVENLRGPALQVAIKIGIDKLLEVSEEGKPVGMGKLKEQTEKFIFPIAKTEIKEL